MTPCGHGYGLNDRTFFYFLNKLIYNEVARNVYNAYNDEIYFVLAISQLRINSGSSGLLDKRFGYHTNHGNYAMVSKTLIK